MLLLSKTQVVASFERPANAADLPSIFEGAALQLVTNTTTGAAEVLRSTDSTSQVFAGIALDPYRFVTTHGQVVSALIPSGGVVVLPFQPVSSSLVGVLEGTTLYTQDVTPAAGSAYVYDTTTVSGKTVGRLTFHASDVGKTLIIQYQAIMSADQVATLYGDQYSRLAPDFTNTVSVITQGDVFTDAFDPTSTWANPLLKITAGGIIASQSSLLQGTNVSTMRLIQAPTQDFPYLGVSLTV